MLQRTWHHDKHIRRRGYCHHSFTQRRLSAQSSSTDTGLEPVRSTAGTTVAADAATHSQSVGGPKGSEACCSASNTSSTTGESWSPRSSDRSSTGPSGRLDKRISMPRRQALLGLAYAAAGTAACSAPAAASAAADGAAPPSTAFFLQPLLPSPTPDLLAQLEGRIPIIQPGVAWALRNRDRQLFYPAWMRGEWQVTARFAAASFPQGRRLLGRTVPGVLKGSMVVALPDVGAAMDAPVRYRARFVDSPQEGGVVADRVFNVRQLMDAFYGFEVTRKVEYEPLQNPTRLTVVYATPRQDKSVISEDLRKAELIINNRISERISPSDFICAELFRQVSQASAQGFVGDYEIISRYTLLQPGAVDVAVATATPTAAATAPSTTAASSGNAEPSISPTSPEAAAAVVTAATAMDDAVAGVGSEVRVLQRVAAFLQPQDAAFFEAGNQAVAAYDYTYDLRRLA